MTTLIDGKSLALEIREEIRQEIVVLRERHGRAPGLAVVIVGEDPASHLYVRNKELACQKAGIESTTYRLPESITEPELLDLITKLKEDPSIDGILVQLPLPKHISEDLIISAIPPEKDVDGFHPLNMGKLVLGERAFRSATPAGVMEMLHRYEIPLQGKHAVVVGRSNIVGKPMALMLLEKHATVTICHSRTQDLPGIVRSGDIVVVAVGKPEMVKGDWIKEGAVVIDVGTNYVEAENRTVGDVAFEEAKLKASMITPVPGGVGPMTTAMLLANTLQAYKNHIEK